MFHVLFAFLSVASVSLENLQGEDVTDYAELDDLSLFEAGDLSDEVFFTDVDWDALELDIED